MKYNLRKTDDGSLLPEMYEKFAKMACGLHNRIQGKTRHRNRIVKHQTNLATLLVVKLASTL
ncbi:MAG: hypothetical protein QXU09_05270 [Thermoproteota archaeon]